MWYSPDAWRLISSARRVDSSALLATGGGGGGEGQKRPRGNVRINGSGRKVSERETAWCSRPFEKAEAYGRKAYSRNSAAGDDEAPETESPPLISGATVTLVWPPSGSLAPGAQAIGAPERSGARAPAARAKSSFWS